jgi:hypothetical protein
MTRKERDEYFATIDWAKTSVKQAASEAEVSYAAAYARWKRSGTTVKPPRKYQWGTVDWGMRTSDIAVLMGTSASAVSSARRKHAPETILRTS